MKAASADNPYLSLAGTGALLFVVILAHELAHAAMARHFGARIRSIMVWPIELRLWPDRRLRFAQRGGRRDLGGAVRYDLDRIGAQTKHAWIAAAGPFGNFVVAGLGVEAALVGGTGRSADVWSAVVLLSASVGIANMLPFKGSDGMTVMRAILRDRSGARVAGSNDDLSVQDTSPRCRP
jgi:Zn-dependent protease